MKRKPKHPYRGKSSISVTAATWAKLKSVADERGVTLASLVTAMIERECA